MTHFSTCMKFFYQKSKSLCEKKGMYGRNGEVISAEREGLKSVALANSNACIDRLEIAKVQGLHVFLDIYFFSVTNTITCMLLSVCPTGFL